MKVSRIGLLVAAAVAVGALTWDLVAQNEPGKQAPSGRIGVCDIKELLENYQRAKDMMDGLQKRKSTLEQEAEKRKERIDHLDAELGQLKKGGPEYEKQFSELQRQVIDGRVWSEFEKTVLLREHHSLTGLLYDDILKMIAQVAKEQGISVVFYFERKLPETKTSPELGQVMEGRKVLYFDPQLDITEAVLKRLNVANKAAGAATAPK